jgi:hypothetical protein
MVPLVTSAGDSVGDAEVLLRTEDDRCILRLRRSDFDVTADGLDFFEALCSVRSQLETEGLLLGTYGGSRRVYPSGMGRDMGRGLRAYRMTMGQHARIEDLVGIFDVGPDVEPATVEQQGAFFRNWLASIGVGPTERQYR